MFTLADVVHFLTNQFTRLCAGTLPFRASSLARSIACLSGMNSPFLSCTQV